MAATFEWHVEFLRTDPNDDNFIKFITCGIYGTENGVTKKTMWKVPFSGKKSDIPVEDWKNYSEIYKDYIEYHNEELLKNPDLNEVRDYLKNRNFLIDFSFYLN